MIFGVYTVQPKPISATCMAVPLPWLTPRCAVKVKDHIMWLGQDGRTYRVFAYTGTTPVPISMPVEDLFSDYVFADPWVYGGTNEFMLFLPDATNSKTVVMVFDVLERQWQTLMNIPGVFNDAAEFGSYLQRRYVNIGLADGTLARLDDSETDFGADIEKVSLVLDPLTLTVGSWL